MTGMAWGHIRGQVLNEWVWETVNRGQHPHSLHPFPPELVQWYSGTSRIFTNFPVGVMDAIRLGDGQGGREAFR